MLCITFLQQWFNMSDPQAEDSLYDSAAMRDLVGIDLGNEAAPDEATICKFRHLIETKSIKIETGTIMDTTRISAPSSTKNEKGDPSAIRRKT